MRNEDNNICQEIVCSNSGQCIRKTAPGQQCSTNGECSSNQFCNNLCLCISAGAPSAHEYLPKIYNAIETDAVDWNNPLQSDTSFVYLQFGNMVRVTFRIMAVENITATDFITTAFKFEVPKGLKAKLDGFRIGSAVLSPNLPVPSFFSEEVVIFSTTTIKSYDEGGRVIVKFLNANPRFGGRLLGDVIEASGFFEYEVGEEGYLKKE
jgi:hypothetical protein